MPWFEFSEQDFRNSLLPAGSEVKGKKGVRVTLSESKYRLFVGNVPRAMSQEELLTALKKQEPGVEVVELPMEPNMPSRNRGYAFVDLYNTASAERAKKTFSGAEGKLRENQLTVRWAEPRKEAPQADMAQVRIVLLCRWVCTTTGLYWHNILPSLEFLPSLFALVHGPGSTFCPLTSSAQSLYCAALQLHCSRVCTALCFAPTALANHLPPIFTVKLFSCARSTSARWQSSSEKFIKRILICTNSLTPLFQLLIVALVHRDVSR
jgi:hypothetical protein